VSEVALQIGGRTYRVACAAGEEDRVRKLGATIAEKLASIGNPTGPDAQNLLFAALLLADEVHDGRDGVAAADDRVAEARREAESASQQLREQVVAMESELARLKSAQQAAADQIGEHEAEVASLQAEIAELRTAPPPPSGDVAMEELAPALEKFAEMLEDCADKLERRAPAP
jgi:cell division protein ZapA